MLIVKILFLDQSGKLGGAELCLADIAKQTEHVRLVGVFADGTFPAYLRQLDVPVKVLTNEALQVKKTSGLPAGLRSLRQLTPLVVKVTQLSRCHDLIYANTQKALVVGAIAAFLSRRPFVYHLHDIVSPEHFSAANCRIIVALANRAALIIANSQASRDAFVLAGGKVDKLHVVYNGFDPDIYTRCADTKRQYERRALRAELISSDSLRENKKTPFIVGHFSRLSPWKGQHVLIEALQYCPDNVVVLLAGDALFGEQDYVQQLQQQIKTLNLDHRVKFLGFRSDVPRLIAACDLAAHTSTAPEPFGRVIVEAMLCGCPVVAAAAGGATEIVEHSKTGWLVPPGDAAKLADVIRLAHDQPVQAKAIAQRGRKQAQQQFNLTVVNAQINRLLKETMQSVFL